jgi:hypothetical protein
MKTSILLTASAFALLSTAAQSAPITTYLGTYINGNDNQTLVNSLLGAPVQLLAKYDGGGSFSNGAIAGSLFSLGSGNAKSGSWSFSGFQSGGFDFVVTHFVVKGGNDFALYALSNGGDPMPLTLNNIAWATVNLFNGGGSAACYNQGANGTTLFNGPASGRGNCSNRNPDVSHISWYGTTRAAPPPLPPPQPPVPPPTVTPPPPPPPENPPASPPPDVPAEVPPPAPPPPQPPENPPAPPPEVPNDVPPPPYTPPLDLLAPPAPPPPPRPPEQTETPPTPVSEPATLALLGTGLLALSRLARRRMVK